MIATTAAAPRRIAERMEEGFRSLGLPTRLSELGIARERLPQVLELSLRNFNADPKRDFVRERDLLAEIRAQADVIIDTSELSGRQLRERLYDSFMQTADWMRNRHG